MTQTFPNSNLTLTETKVDLPGFLCPFLISWKVSVWFRFLWFNYSCLWLEPFSISIEGLSYWEWTEQFIFCISAHSNALSYTKETINETSPSDETQLDLTIIVHVCLTLFSSQDLNVNPLTPKIWLLILPSSCYIFPCELDTRIWC